MGSRGQALTHVLSRQLPLFPRTAITELQIVIQEVVRRFALQAVYPLRHLSSLIVEEDVRSKGADMLVEAGMRVRLK